MRRAVIGAYAVVLALGLPYALLLLPAVRPQPGYSAAIDGWLNGLVDAAVLVAVVVRAVVDRRGRTGWLWIAAGLASALGASIAYYAYYQFQPASGLTWSDVGWLAFYVLLFVGVVRLVHGQVRRAWAGLWLDGVVAGLTAAALAVAYVPGADPVVPGNAATDLVWAYPVADLMLVAVAVAALAMLGRAGGRTWWLVSASFLTFAVTDWVYAEQVAAGSYVGGGPLDLGWLLARLALVAAAWTSLRRRGAEVVTVGGFRMLAVPGACALASLGLLFHATTTTLPTTATALALAAGVAVVGRTMLTVQEIRTLAEVTRQARTDELTGLPNRRHFYDLLGAGELTHRHCAVLLIDLDRFKEVNDSLGHREGDELLRQVARWLRELVADSGVLARLGGDEFAILLDGATQDDAVRMAARVRATLQRPVQLGAAAVVIDGSVGIALAPEHAGTPEELLQVADLAMYAAKGRRRGVLVYDEARDGMGRRRLELIAELRQGIGEGQLRLHFQPQLELRTGRVVAVEALVRWQHPTRGLLGPGDFIDLAESAGLMGLLTTWVVEDALRQCRQWRDEGLHLRVAVNVSPSAVVDRAFPQQVERLLRHHGIPAERLVLEVTEELLMNNPQRTVDALSVVRGLGVGVSIDDYGTGYSSLAYLKDLPVTELKLDRSFIASMGSSARSSAIVRSTLNLAHALGLHLVAEGVEDEATLLALAGLGCDLAQGYHLSRPLVADDVPDAVRRIATALARA
ncbi:putative bifunctional diguanylate cyclase/phosphodiesterase [Cellulomonas aerilata]|uniref:GGDEF-domain containing protein n=1 Tax=Cellulomonas aerilata TaxID=515326 RepID=A0A512DBT1_9CELL|nr:bifunctional diguanylate cyclase/phosphodiesterase [Cellulomonas aerilata]GEO33923.1 hypothetical protein CAE01nite_16480 [Cellulomonas aerilata]